MNSFKNSDVNGSSAVLEIPDFVVVRLADGAEYVFWREGVTPYTPEYQRCASATTNNPQITHQFNVEIPNAPWGEYERQNGGIEFGGKSVFANAAKAALPPCVDPLVQHEMYPDD